MCQHRVARKYGHGPVSVFQTHGAHGHRPHLEDRHCRSPTAYAVAVAEERCAYCGVALPAEGHRVVTDAPLLIVTCPDVRPGEAAFIDPAFMYHGSR